MAEGIGETIAKSIFEFVLRAVFYPVRNRSCLAQIIYALLLLAGLVAIIYMITLLIGESP